MAIDRGFEDCLPFQNRAPDLQNQAQAPESPVPYFSAVRSHRSCAKRIPRTRTPLAPRASRSKHSCVSPMHSRITDGVNRGNGSLQDTPGDARSPLLSPARL
ncbi:hypothetical protein AAFF_G00215370 [Aldrovandia affinis]|uniref:Uncharacterized protein n=1 Tax=Aldrovandia affinis TaxID=143900 RepID=A0AAD7RGN2_9TELE|nr:hypothetical protein AAFF_G00215370 [Aldrovandia affinis]